MSRGEKHRKVGMMGILIGMLITAALVVGVFSMLPHHVLQGEWPLGIHSAEVQRYTELADVRRIEQQITEPQGEAFIIGGSRTGGDCLLDQHSILPQWRWFEAQGYGDSVRVLPSTTIPKGYEIRFQEGSPFRGQQAIIISPASAESIRMKYAEVLAHELGLATPAISFVRVVACNKEQRVHVVEELIGEGFLARRRFSEAVLFKRSFDPERTDQVFPELIGDTAQAGVLRSMLALLREDVERDRLDRMSHTLDDQAAAGWLLMHWLEGAPDPLHQENYFAFHWNRGRTTPMHRPSRIFNERDSTAAGSWAYNVFTPWLKVPAFQETLTSRRNELIGKRSQIEALFAAVDSTWLPVLANDAPIAEVRAVADRIKSGIFDRMEEGDPIAFLDRPMVETPGTAALMQGQEVAKRYWPTENDIDGVRAIADRYKARLHGDSIVFPRGKYAIEEDLIVPKGYALILLSGARLNISPGVNILCQGPLHIRGSRLNPVFIRPGGGAFGTVAVMGDGDTQCSISGLQISGGAGARINGVQHPAMLSVQDAGASRFAGCIFSAPAGDVALFVQGGAFEMDDCTMFNSQVEVRDVNGAVRESQFQGGTRGAGTGGLVVNASTIAVENCGFTGIRSTAFAANDGSIALVRSSQISQCGVAIEATDLSEVHLVENSISGNRTALSAKRNKPLYGGAKIFVYTNDLQRNANERAADEHSSITDAERFDESVMQKGNDG